MILCLCGMWYGSYRYCVVCGMAARDIVFVWYVVWLLGVMLCGVLYGACERQVISLKSTCGSDRHRQDFTG